MATPRSRAVVIYIHFFFFGVAVFTDNSLHIALNGSSHRHMEMVVRIGWRSAPRSGSALTPFT